MPLELAAPQLTQLPDAWLVVIPARFGRLQRYRFQVEGHARRFLGLFTRAERHTARNGWPYST